jgi:RNA polymerase sigma-70 factor (ECF subfamily)
MEDEKIISLLFARDESGLQHTKTKYGSLYHHVLRQILKDEEDVKECANDVLMALWNSIPPQFPQRFAAYITTVARRIGINRYKHNGCQKRGSGYTKLLSELEDCMDPRQTLPDVDLRRVLRTFLQNLDGQSRVLFIRRYYYLESVKELADRFAVSASFVSVRLHRARKQLRNMLKEEGIHL